MAEDLEKGDAGSLPASDHADPSDPSPPAKALPRGVDPPAMQSPEREARELVSALELAQTLPQRERAESVADEARAFQRASGLTVDGVYGPRTRTELARVLEVPASRLPAPLSASSSSRAPADSPEIPAWLQTAAALARWTEDARASDSVASQKLARLAPHAARIAPLTNTAMAGISVGQVPSAPTAADAAAWAANAWERTRAQGQAARASLASHSQAITRQAEQALADVRRALDRETDTAVRGALEMVERGLVAILRPASTAIRRIVEPIGPGLALGALAILAFMSGGSRRR